MDFAKVYSVDLIAGEGALYELKTATQIVQEHESQLLNYLLLLDCTHGKVINFRTNRVTSRFVNTNLTRERRLFFQLREAEWRPLSDRCEFVKACLLGLIQDWGLFLELPLYVEALIHFLGGEVRVVQPVPLSRSGIALGAQPMLLLQPDTALRLTALADSASYKHHF